MNDRSLSQQDFFISIPKDRPDLTWILIQLCILHRAIPLFDEHGRVIGVRTSAETYEQMRRQSAFFANAYARAARAAQASRN